MAAQDCIDRIAKAMGDADLDDQVRMAEEADRIVRDSVGLSEEEIFAKLDASILDQTIAKKIEGRNKALNSLKQRSMENFIDGFKDKVLGSESLLVGINDVVRGGRKSAANTQKNLEEFYTSGFIADMEDLGRPAFDAFVSGEMDLDVARALWAIDIDQNFKGMNQDAVDVAHVISKWQEKTRIDGNEAGAYIRKLPGYIARQSHDMDKIRNAKFPEWRKMIEPLLDERTFAGVDDREAFLLSAWRGLATGLHFGNGSIPGLKGTKNLAKSASQERVLHFKDADGWSQYNEKFGRGSLIDTIQNGMRMSAQNTGLMKIMGPNAESNFETVMEKFLKDLSKTDPDAAVKLDSALGKGGSLRNFMQMINGETNIPGNALGATIGQSVRALNSTTMLGQAVISSATDIPNSALELRYQGKGFFSTYAGALKMGAGALGDIGKSILNRRLTVGTPESRRVMAELGVSLDSTSGLFTSRFDPSGELINGRVSRAMRTFFRLNGLTLWTDSMRHGSIIGMAQHVGDLAAKSFDSIPVGLQDTLTLYGIGGKEWDLIRSVGAKPMDGVDGKFLTPEMIQDIDVKLLVAHLESAGVKATDFRIKKLRADLEDSLRGYYVDRSQFAVIEPDAKTRAMMLRDSAPGTVAGEFMRSIMQFKAFPFAIAQKVWGREIRGRRTKTAAFMGMSEYIIASTFFGYIAMNAKDLAKNREPRPPNSLKSWGAAFLQGGAAGIYGDFLFGDLKTRHGGGLLSTALGPTAGQIDKAANIIGKLKEGDTDVGKDAFRLLYQSAPAVAGLVVPAATVLNTVYAKAALDNLIYYNIMESLSPGYKRRIERRLKKENDQEVLIK